MIDWASSMTHTYEFWEVDPVSWRDKRKINTIISCSIKRDLDSEILESATFRTTELRGECYIRVYMIASQNGMDYQIPLGTFMVQTPSVTYDGKVQNINMDAYSPLLELRDKLPPLGFTILKNQNVMNNVCSLTEDNVRTPTINVTGHMLTLVSDYTAEPNEKWLQFLIKLMELAGYKYTLDELSRIGYAPNQETNALTPVWTYNDDNSSILYPEIQDSYDLYGVPNVVEVSYTGPGIDGKDTTISVRVENTDPTSPTSIPTRGREVVYRETSPNITGAPTQSYIQDYASRLLEQLSTIEHTISYTHGYCPVKIGDCVRINYTRAGLTDIKARVKTQDIDCSSGCKVTETAVYTSKLWEGV